MEGNEKRLSKHLIIIFRIHKMPWNIKKVCYLDGVGPSEPSAEGTDSQGSFLYYPPIEQFLFLGSQSQAVSDWRLNWGRAKEQSPPSYICYQERSTNSCGSCNLRNKMSVGQKGLLFRKGTLKISDTCDCKLLEPINSIIRQITVLISKIMSAIKEERFPQGCTRALKRENIYWQQTSLVCC